VRRYSRKREDIVDMAYIQGEGRNQGTLFPVILDELVPADHECRVIDALVDTLAMSSALNAQQQPTPVALATTHAIC
jgi:hypothetical protein